MGFEPTVRLRAQRFSRPPRSTTPAPLRWAPEPTLALDRRQGWETPPSASRLAPVYYKDCLKRWEPLGRFPIAAFGFAPSRVRTMALPWDQGLELTHGRPAAITTSLTCRRAPARAVGHSDCQHPYVGNGAGLGICAARRNAAARFRAVLGIGRLALRKVRAKSNDKWNAEVGIKLDNK